MSSSEYAAKASFDVPYAWFRYLSQGDTWTPKDRDALPITDMDASWRRNAAAWLLRQAPALVHRYSLGEAVAMFVTTLPVVIGERDGQPVYSGEQVRILEPRGEMAQEAFEREQEARFEDPEEWLKSTPLYRALLAGLDQAVVA